jgi:hypothetical protein
MLLLSFPRLIRDFSPVLEAQKRSADIQFLRPGVPEQYKPLYLKQREILIETYANHEAPVYETVGGGLALHLRPLSRLEARIFPIQEPR